MNHRKIFREYAKNVHKREAKEFVSLNSEFGECGDTLITKNNNGEYKETYINYKDMCFWLFHNYIKNE